MEEEEEEVGVSLIRKKKYTNDSAQKSVTEPTLKCAQLLASVIINQFEKHPETSVVENQEAVVVDALESDEVQAAEVMDGLKIVVSEASVVLKEVVSQIVAP